MTTGSSKLFFAQAISPGRRSPPTRPLFREFHEQLKAAATIHPTKNRKETRVTDPFADFRPPATKPEDNGDTTTAAAAAERAVVVEGAAAVAAAALVVEIGPP